MSPLPRLVLALVVLLGPVAAADPLDDRASVRAFLESHEMRSIHFVGVAPSQTQITELYASREYAPLWIREERITPQARNLLQLMSAAEQKGLRPDDYGVASLARQVKELRTPEGRARFDVAMTASAMSFVSDLHVGRVNPRRVLASYEVDDRVAAVPGLLTKAAESRDVGALIQQLEPPYHEYLRLESALQRHRKILEDGDQEPFVAARLIKPGEAWPGTSRLAAFLKRTGDLPAEAKPAKYSGALVAAVKKFQRRHGLHDDGVIGESTLAALNVPISRRVQQIELALERWRWAPDFDRPPVIVNIPEFRLTALGDDRRPALSMKVIVGQAYTHNTPVFQSAITELIFFPNWNVPPSIQHEEIVPAVVADRRYLARNGYEAVRGDGSGATSVVTPAVLAGLKSGSLMVRQRPGSGNSLGKLKFVLPNDKNVYLHDTPGRHLFGQSRRDLSHGCIRVEHPAKLAAWVLQSNSGWNDSRIRSALRSGRTSSVGVARPVPLLIMYATAVVDETGEVRFLDDIYGYDDRLERELQQRGAS